MTSRGRAVRLPAQPGRGGAGGRVCSNEPRSSLDAESSVPSLIPCGP
eukprot:CAMPEP_0206014438 /NCGR_PEP_ID=MMETSP1464-20131121/18331_1 /ASSEMBLY_ACC=CAM_ASM_001124 /TAXON_ID=119497 /ORGANISM="Exanthemachrysis gayraliae, Strain RCC1523" /LENGTH=46 /DNA_ID= /DNA_START= /DNA_END= /DNA_ORIENTATION=